MGIKEGRRGTGNTLVAMEPKPDGKDNSPISTGNWHHNACYPQGAKSPCLCTTVIAKSHCEDNPVQRIMAIGAVVNI